MPSNTTRIENVRLVAEGRSEGGPEESGGQAMDLGLSRLLSRNKPILYLSESAPTFQQRSYEASKRVVDVLGSLLLLLAGLLLLVIVSLLVKTTSRGPVLFRQKRLGRRGREFWCFKFRTMVADAEDQLKNNAHLHAEFEQGYKLKNDPRVTRVGAVLRKTSLDELPQLLNVLCGDMSLIGPRPIVPSERFKYGVDAPKLLTVKPGLGGLWQASGRSDVSYEDRVKLDMLYIDHRSLRLDLTLLVMTALSVCRFRGAY